MKKLFVIHGWTYSTQKWEPFVDFMKQNGVEVKILKVPGLTDNSEGVWDLDKYAEWLKKELSSQKELPVLLGHSNGGRIALFFTSKYPKSLKKLILIDSAGIYHQELLLELKRYLFKNAAKVGKKITSLEKVKNLLYKVAGESDYLKASSSMKKTMTNLISIDLTLILSQILIPTIIIWGELDKITPVSDGKLMHSLIKNSKYYLIEKAGHSPFYSHTDEVGKKILEEI